MDYTDYLDKRASRQRQQEAFDQRRKQRLLTGVKGQIPKNNTPELAQWYLERGQHEKMNIGYGILGILMPPIAPIVIPIVLGYYFRGRKMVKIGKQMNAAAGRNNYMRPHGFSGNNFHRPSESVPDARYGPVPATPPVEPIWT